MKQNLVSVSISASSHSAKPSCLFLMRGVKRLEAAIPVSILPENRNFNNQIHAQTAAATCVPRIMKVYILARDSTSFIYAEFCWNREFVFAVTWKEHVEHNLVVSQLRDLCFQVTASSGRTRSFRLSSTRVLHYA